MRSSVILPPATVLVAGATGSIGRLVVDEALQQGYRVRALVRDIVRAKRVLPAQTELVLAEITRADALHQVIDGVDAIVFTLGAGSIRGEGAQDVDYGGVRNLLFALGERKPRIALMTAIGVTKRADAQLGRMEGHDWKRRSERLVRASGCTYTIVRPGWFDGNRADQHRLQLLQGDRRWASNPSDGVVARQQIAEVLVRSLSTTAAAYKTVELVAEKGPATRDFETLFASTQVDAPGALDAVNDRDNMPLADEPSAVKEDLAARAAGGISAQPGGSRR